MLADWSAECSADDPHLVVPWHDPNSSAHFINLRAEPYVLPETFESYSGSVLCLAQTAEPDTAAFNAPEIVFRMKKHHHAGLIVKSEDPNRVRELLEEYAGEFANRFLASMPAPDKPTA